MLENIIVGIIILAALFYGLSRVRASLKGGGCGCGGSCSSGKNIKHIKTPGDSDSAQPSCCGNQNTPFSSNAHTCKCQNK